MHGLILFIFLDVAAIKRARVNGQNNSEEVKIQNIFCVDLIEAKKLMLKEETDTYGTTTRR